MPSKPRGAAGAEPIAADSNAFQPSNTQDLPPPSTEGMSKEREDCWELLIKGLEDSIEKEPEGPRRENIIACLNFAREHGYPEESYCLWAVDGVARCMERNERIKYASRNQEHVRDAVSYVSCGIYVYLLPTKLHADIFQLGGPRWLH